MRQAVDGPVLGLKARSRVELQAGQRTVGGNSATCFRHQQGAIALQERRGGKAATPTGIPAGGRTDHTLASDRQGRSEGDFSNRDTTEEGRTKV